MANQNENNNENEQIRVPVGIRLDGDVHAAIENIRVLEDRPSVSNMVERLLKTHPRVKRALEAETATV